jgi:hypothetical protein
MAIAARDRPAAKSSKTGVANEYGFHQPAAPAHDWCKHHGYPIGAASSRSVASTGIAIPRRRSFQVSSPLPSTVSPRSLARGLLRSEHAGEIEHFSYGWGKTKSSLTTTDWQNRRRSTIYSTRSLRSQQTTAPTIGSIVRVKTARPAAWSTATIFDEPSFGSRPESRTSRGSCPYKAQRLIGAAPAGFPRVLKRIGAICKRRFGIA